MTTIAELRNEYKEMMKNCVLSNPELHYRDKKESMNVALSANEFAIRGTGRNTLKFLSQVVEYATIPNFLVVSFEIISRYGRDSVRLTPNKNETSFFQSTYRLMKLYWEKYAGIKGLQGVLFLTTREKVDDVLKEDFTRNFETGIPEFNRIIKRSLKGYAYDFTGYVLFEDEESFETKVSKFHKTINHIEEIFENNQLLSIRSEASPISLYYQTLPMHYVGESFSIKIEEDFECITLLDSRNAEIKSKISIEDFHKYLDELKQINRLKNVVNTPKFNFEGVITKLFPLSLISEDNISREFEKLENVFGDWESVEREFNHIKNNLKNAKDSLLYKYEELESQERYVIHKLKGETYNYVLVTQNYKLNSVTKQRLWIYVNEIHGTQVVEDILKNLMFGKLMWHLRQGKEKLTAD